MRPETKIWFEHYDRWVADCRDELIEKGFHADDVKNVDICENGQVYFGNLTITGKEYVTPWEKSEHFAN